MASLSEVTLTPILDSALSPANLADREAAMEDLTAEAELQPIEPGGEAPYRLELGFETNRLGFELRDKADKVVVRHLLSLTPFKRPLREYYEICQAYEQAALTGPPDRIEILDRARRHQHDALAELLQTRLEGKVAMDHATSRRLMTLVSSLFYGTDLV